MRVREVLNNQITRLLQIKHRLELPNFHGSHFISPQPPYISQFIGIYPSAIDLDTPLTNKDHIGEFGAKDAAEFTFWAWRNCGIACVKMILESENKANDKTVMDLTHEGMSLGGYILYKDGEFVDRGWYHKPLVLLMRRYGVDARTKRWQTPESVARDVLNNKKVMLSVHVPGRKYIKEDGSFNAKENARYGGHLLLAIGVKIDGKKIDGIYVHDPRGLERYKDNTFVPRAVLDRIFLHRTIVAD